MLQAPLSPIPYLHDYAQYLRTTSKKCNIQLIKDSGLSIMSVLQLLRPELFLLALLFLPIYKKNDFYILIFVSVLIISYVNRLSGSMYAVLKNMFCAWFCLAHLLIYGGILLVSCMFSCMFWSLSHLVCSNKNFQQWVWAAFNLCIYFCYI